MTDISKIPTYQAGVYQARAYRALKNLKNNVLKRHDLTMMQWVVLGYIYDYKEVGVRITELAKSLDTTQAFITNTVNKLQAKGFVKRVAHVSDSRAKMVTIEPRHVKLVEEIEHDVREELRTKLYSKITRDELQAYINVITKFGQD